MKAKFVYEKLEDILKPKSEKDIMSSMGDLDPNELLIHSAYNGFLSGVKIAIERGADIHGNDDDALRFASQNGHYDIVALLLDNGANVHAENDYALRHASYYGRYDIVKLLLSSGANIHDANALQYASENGHTDVVDLLKKWMEKDEG